MHLSSPLPRRAFHARLSFIVLLALGAAALLFAMPALPQDVQYHNFADQRSLWSVPNALNVISNLPFLVVGVLGVGWLLTRAGRTAGRHFTSPWEWYAQLLLFGGVALTGLGSAYYHAHPTNDTLYWDRLPLTVVFMTFFVLVVGERVSLRAGLWLFGPCVALGLFGVTYWRWSELQGAGDLRFYGLVQYFPLLVLPILLVLFPPRYTGSADLWGVLGWYALAKALELLDRFVYAAGGLVSGHTLKHVFASMGALWLLLHLMRRRPLAQAASTRNLLAGDALLAPRFDEG
jgi:hypothetical protein